MSRKRKSDEEPSTDTAVADTPESSGVEPTVGEPKPEGFAEKVGQRPPLPDPFGIAKDNVVGVRLFESRQDRQVAIKFGEGRPEDKPSQAVIDKMKESGFRWNPSHKVWTHPVRPDSAMSTRIEAEKLFQEVRSMIRAEKGIEASPEVPF